MILTDQEMRELRDKMEMQSGLHKSLIERCGTLMHNGKFDDAVRSAFVLLEERLKEAVNVQHMTGTNLAMHAFNREKGVLSKALGHSKQEQLGLQDLYTGAFRLFRNPTAHNTIDYSVEEAKSILYLVNLLIQFLDRIKHLPPPNYFNENIETALKSVEQNVGFDASTKLRVFLGQCLKLGVTPHKGKVSIPFKTYALQTRPQWSSPKRHTISLFYLMAHENYPSLWFPVNQYYSYVVGLDIEPIKKRLLALGFKPLHQLQDFEYKSNRGIQQQLLDDLFELVEEIYEQFKATLI